MSVHFEEDLETLKRELLAMADHAHTAMTHAVTALTERDAELARQAIVADSILDRFEMEVDDLSIQLLAKAPLAKDLRFITIAMKISHNLERVGDEATKIARWAEALAVEDEEFEVEPAIESMTELARSMLKDAVDSFINYEPAQARALISRDKEVDALNKATYRMLTRDMVKHPHRIGRCLQQIMIAKCLERIADHATNIAEQVIYLHEGRDVRHAKNRSAQSV